MNKKSAEAKTLWSSLDIITIPVKAHCLNCRKSFIKHPVFVTAEIYCPICGRKCHTKTAPRGAAYITDEEPA